MKDRHSPFVIEAGIDESGRGPCFGRVYAAAVIWPEGLESPLVRDSKTLNKNQLKEAYKFIKENVIDYSVAYATEKEIDRLNILHANMLAMHRAIDGLLIKPTSLIIDGNYFKPYLSKDDVYIDFSTIVKGDSQYYSIAAASILAKVDRDSYIDNLVMEYPLLDTYYGLSSNKGYIGGATHAHKVGIMKHGITPFHRESYKCCKDVPLMTLETLKGGTSS